MKKYMTIVVSICMSASLLMGCGSSGGGKNMDAQPKEEAQQEVQQETEAQADEKVTGEMPSQTDGYIVFVKDANTDEPLAGVKVQFCSDSQCMMGLTDNTGAAVFKMDPGNYDAHILKPPAGYQKSSETAKLTATDKVAVLALLKEGEELKAAEAADVLSGVTLQGPHRPFEVPPIGTKVSFETTDLQGNAVSSADLFAGHKVTMINLWATWCTYCKQELPELEELSKELAEKNCQIIGICEDLDDDNVQEAIKILENNGVTYTNIKQTDESAKTLRSIGLPTTYFVDSEGRILTTPVRGMDVAKYKEKIEEALKAVE